MRIMLAHTWDAIGKLWTREAEEKGRFSGGCRFWDCTLFCDRAVYAAAERRRLGKRARVVLVMKLGK